MDSGECMHCILGAIAGNGASFESRDICVYGCFAATSYKYRVLPYALAPSRSPLVRFARSTSRWLPSPARAILHLSEFKIADARPIGGIELSTRIEADTGLPTTLQLGHVQYRTVVLHRSGLRTITDSMKLWKSRRFFMARYLHCQISSLVSMKRPPGYSPSLSTLCPLSLTM
jgi:hypothetical protein